MKNIIYPLIMKSRDKLSVAINRIVIAENGIAKVMELRLFTK